MYPVLCRKIHAVTDHYRTILSRSRSLCKYSSIEYIEVYKKDGYDNDRVCAVLFAKTWRTAHLSPDLVELS